MCDFNKLKNGILGFIIGDALGVPLEFKKREIFKNNKVTDMISSDSDSGKLSGFMIINQMVG